MFDLKDSLWAGSQAALDCARTAEAQVIAARAAGMKAGGFNDDDDDCPYMRAGNVAIIPVQGPLLNVDSPLLAFFGLTGYPVIRRSAIKAAQDPSIDHILLDVNSPGGAVSGVADTGDLLARINSKVKPVTAYVGGTMASAAYWIGASAGQIFASRTAEIGSIGVITTHTDVTKMLENEGIKKTVLRAGEFKALSNPFEALTPEARDQIQTALDAAYKVFVQHVADCRGVTYAVADAKMAQGRQFFGAAARTAGLIDGLSSFDALVSALQAKKVDKPKRSV